jgi:hypothetical protein
MVSNFHEFFLYRNRGYYFYIVLFCLGFMELDLPVRHQRRRNIRLFWVIDLGFIYVIIRINDDDYSDRYFWYFVIGHLMSYFR